MANPCRIGDPIEDGDCVAQGSEDVIIGDMPCSVQGCSSTGHSKFPSSPLVGPCTTTIFVNDKPVVLAGVTKIKPHKVPRKPFHDATCKTGCGSVDCE